MFRGIGPHLFLSAFLSEPRGDSLVRAPLLLLQLGQLLLNLHSRPPLSEKGAHMHTQDTDAQTNTQHCLYVCVCV